MEQPTINDQEELLSINDNGKIEIAIPETKDKFKLGWMKPYTLERASALILKKEGKIDDYDPKLMSKLASLYILNGIKIIFFHSLFWRYLYYIKGYRYDQLYPLLEAAKKKAPAEAYIKAIISAFGIKVTAMTLTEEEVESIQAERSSE